jgi:hypothetical protein
MAATPARRSESFTGTLIAWLLGSWLVDYLVMDTRFKILGAAISLAFL